jgi:hypothetical protein
MGSSEYPWRAYAFPFEPGILNSFSTASTVSTSIIAVPLYIGTPEQLPLMVVAHTPPVPHAMLGLPANPAAHAPEQDAFTAVPLQLTGQAPLASSALGVVGHVVAAAAAGEETESALRRGQEGNLYACLVPR